MIRTDRRRVLRGAGGLALGVPWLEGLAPRRAAAATAPRRMAIVFCCNGVNMSRFFPTTPYGPLTAASFSSTQSTAALAPFASKLLVPRGLFQTPRGYNLDPGGGNDHDRGCGSKLTCSPLSGGVDVYATGVSIDQVVAHAINPGGKGPLNLMVGSRARGVLGCVSYSAPGRQADPILNPWTALKDWVGAGSNPMVGPTVDANAGRRRSILDLVKSDLARLQASPALASKDREKLDYHVTAVRQLELGLTSISGSGAAATRCVLPQATLDKASAMQGKNVQDDALVPQIAPLMMEILALSLACDHNRVATLQFGSGAVGPIFGWLAASNDLNGKYNHHKLSHGSTDGGASPNLPTPAWTGALKDIDTWHMGQFRLLLERLSGYQEGGQTVLDNSAVVYVNELADGSGHSWWDLPTIIAGSAGGYLKQGQYLKLSGAGSPIDYNAPMNQFWTTIANAVGARKADGSPMTNFGNPGPMGKAGEMSALKA
jgi:hypothetical protein